MLLIRLHGIFSELSGGGGGVVGYDGSEKQFLDGYIYPDSDFTEWKLVMPTFVFRIS